MIQPRLATTSDADTITRLVDQAYGHYVERIGRKPKPMTIDYLTAIQDHPLWVIDDAAAGIKAVLELIPGDTFLLIENIAVAPVYQKQGLGRALMAFAETQARQQGFDEVRLYTNERYVENIALYQRLGYTETHRDVFRGSNVIHMHKMLSE